MSDLHQRLHAQNLAVELMKKHGLDDWCLNFNGSQRLAGICIYPDATRPGRIELSRHHVELNPLEVVKDTVLHEIAHALVGPGHGHDAVWKLKCIEIGAKPVRCYDAADVKMPAGRWRARCESCGKEFHRHRRPRSLTGYWCRACGPERGGIVWSYRGGDAT